MEKEEYDYVQEALALIKQLQGEEGEEESEEEEDYQNKVGDKEGKLQKSSNPLCTQHHMDYTERDNRGIEPERDLYKRRSLVNCRLGLCTLNLYVRSTRNDWFVCLFAPL